MIKAEYTHEVLRKDIHCPKGLLEQRKYAELESFFTELWLSRHKKPLQIWEREWFDLPYHMFKEMFIQQGVTALKHINEWSNHYPESFFPYIVRVRYWAVWSSEYRGGEWSSQVTDDMWDCAREAQKQLYATAMQALAFNPNTWTVALHLLNSTAKFDEPKWFDAWFLQHKTPSNLVHKIKPSAQVLAQKSGLNNELKIELPLQVPDILVKYQSIKNTIQLPQAEAAFWLKIFIEESGFGLVAAIDYCWFLLPRWGYEYTDILKFIESDWCKHFSEIEKSELNFIIWSDSVDVSLDKEQTVEIKNYIDKAQVILKRPLSEENRATIYLKLAYLYFLLDEKDSRILNCYQQAADYTVFDKYDLDRAVYYWRHSAKDSNILGRICKANRKSLASAAVLYGFLCQHGWSNVEKNPLVSLSWYDYAQTLEPAKPYPEGRFCCFYRVANNFEDDEGYQSIIDLLHYGADLGYVYCAFISGYIHSLEHHALKNVQQELKYARKAAEQGHFIAMYNMGIHYLNLAIDESQTQPEEYLKKSFSFFEQSRIGLETSSEQGHYSNQSLIDDIIDLYITRLFQYSYYPEIADQILKILKVKAEQRHVPSMCAIARLHFDHQNRPHYFSYEEAVKWCQAAYLQEPQHETVQDVLTEIMGNSKSSIKRYNQTVGTIPAYQIPGRQDVLF